MNMNMAMVEPPEAASVVTRDRVVCFVNDELSAAALRKGLEGSNLSIRRGTIRHAIRMLETDAELFALVADIRGVCSRGGTREITWYPRNAANEKT